MSLTYSLKRTTAPTSEPLTRAECKTHLRLSADTTDDDAVDRLLTAAREIVERDLRMSLLPQTWTLKLDEFRDEIELHYGPVTSVTSITYVDGTGSTQTVSGSDYTLDAQSDPAIVRLTYNGTWPTHRGDIRGITVVYAAGFASAAVVPASIKSAILLKLSALYDGEAIFGTSYPLRDAYDAIVNGIRGGSYP